MRNQECLSMGTSAGVQNNFHWSGFAFLRMETWRKLWLCYLCTYCVYLRVEKEHISNKAQAEKEVGWIMSNPMKHHKLKSLTTNTIQDPICMKFRTPYHYPSVRLESLLFTPSLLHLSSTSYLIKKHLLSTQGNHIHIQTQNLQFSLTKQARHPT